MLPSSPSAGFPPDPWRSQTFRCITSSLSRSSTTSFLYLGPISTFALIELIYPYLKAFLRCACSASSPSSERPSPEHPFHLHSRDKSYAMSSQGMTRKRPAPGTSPIVHPQMNAVADYASANPDLQLSNDQFLQQWGQNSSANVINPASFTNPSSFNPPGYAASQDLSGSTATPSNQLTRRQQANQLVTRNRGFESVSTTYPDSNTNAGQGESGAWGESLEELYQRALAAKREAQAKRKQIPPFVQKLSRYVKISKYQS